MKNLGHPTAEQLIARRLEWLGLPEHIERRSEYANEISKEEFERDQYLWTMYRYEIDNNLTTLNYDEWVLQTLQRNCQLRSFISRTGLLDSDRQNFIEFLCSKRLSLLNHIDSSRRQLIDFYGDESYTGGFDYSDCVKGTGTNIVLLGNQNAGSAVKTFNAVSDGEISLTYMFVCSKVNFVRMKRTMATIDSSILPTDSKCLIDGRDYFEKVDDAAFFARRITKSGRCKSLY